MGILGIVLLVFLIIVAILLVLIVIVQDEGGEGLGGIFGGSSNSTFGSRTGNVVTRATTVLGGLFLVLALGLAYVNRSTGAEGIEKAVKETATEETSDSKWYLKNSADAAPTASAVPDGRIEAFEEGDLPVPPAGE